jgi:hypothetical protein
MRNTYASSSNGACTSQRGWGRDVEVSIVCWKGCEGFISIASEANQGSPNGSVRFCEVMRPWEETVAARNRRGSMIKTSYQHNENEWELHERDCTKKQKRRSYLMSRLDGVWRSDGILCNGFMVSRNSNCQEESCWKWWWKVLLEYRLSRRKSLFCWSRQQVFDVEMHSRLALILHRGLEWASLLA